MKRASKSDDLQSVERIKAGDSAEFRILVEKYKDVSYSLACSILKNDQEAEDALQESFMKVFKNIHKFRNKSSFSTWIYRIVVNTCFTIAKKQDKMQSYDDPASSIGSEWTDHSTGYDSLTAYERKKIINTAFKMMKSDEALLLRLYYLSELDVREIREVTGFTESKIKVTLHRGRISLQEALEKLLGKELGLFIQ